MNRDAIYAAMFALVSPTSVYAWKNTPTRRLKLWANVPTEQRPALFQFEGGDENYSWSNSANPKRILPAALFVYTSAADDSVPGTTQLNQIIDAIELALQPKGADVMLGRNTLGGLVYSCRIEGTVFKDPGDLDADGMVKIPISILVP